MTTTVIKLQSDLTVDAPIASFGKEAVFIQLYNPTYMWRFGSQVSSTLNNGIRDLICGKKLTVLKNKPMPTVSEKYITLGGDTALVTENTTEEITSSESFSIACAIRMNIVPTLPTGIISNHKKCEFGVTSGTSGYKGLTTGTTAINDISFMVASMSSRVTDDDAKKRTDGKWHTVVGVYNKDTSNTANNTAKLYIDGQLIASVVLDPSGSAGQAGAYPEDSMHAKRLLVGALLTTSGDLSTAYNFLNADLANIAFFNQALSAQACIDYNNYINDYV